MQNAFFEILSDPRTAVFQFDSDRVGNSIFQTQGGEVTFIVYGDGTGFVTHGLLNHVFLNSPPRTCKLKWKDFSSVSYLRLDSFGMLGIIDFSIFTLTSTLGFRANANSFSDITTPIFKTQFHVRGCPNLELLTVTSHANPVTTFLIDGNIKLADIDLTPLTDQYGYINSNGCSVAETLLFNPSSKDWTTGFHVYNMPKLLDLDCSGQTGRIRQVRAYGNVLMTSIQFAGSFGTMEECDITGSLVPVLDISGAIDFEVNYSILARNCSLLVTLTLPTTTISGGSTRIYIDNTSLPGVDFSMLDELPNDTLLGEDSSFVTFTPPVCTMSVGVTRFSCRNASLAYFDSTVCVGWLDANNCDIDLFNNGMNATTVDHFLVDFVNNISIGGFTGRTIQIHGTNAAPTDGTGTGFDGIQAVSDLTTIYNVTVTHS